MGRRRILGAVLERLRPGRRDLLALDIGCGTGVNLKFLSQYGRVIGLDSEELAVKLCQEGGQGRALRGDVREIPFRDRSFDVVVAMDVMEHVDDDAGMLQEVRRVLKPGGLLYLTVPAFMFLWSLQDDVSLHRRRYTLRLVKNVVEKGGFRIRRISYMNFFLFPLIFALRLGMRVFGVRLDSENRLNPRLTNGLFTWIFALEARILPWRNLPVGVSVLCVAETLPPSPV